MCNYNVATVLFSVIAHFSHHEPCILRERKPKILVGILGLEPYSTGELVSSRESWLFERRVAT